MVNRFSTAASALGLFFPFTCLLCGNEGVQNGLCKGCRHDLPTIQLACQRCGTAALSNSLCARCISKPPNYDQVITAYSYKPPVSQLIKGMKYNQRLEILSAFGVELNKQIEQQSEVSPDCLIPVPLHFFRLMRRGFNQCVELANFLGKHFSTPVDHSLIKRTKTTLPQFDLPHNARCDNVYDAFRVKRKTAYKSVALVDDVVTSGATVNELARLLKQAGVTHVSVWALARAS